MRSHNLYRIITLPLGGDNYLFLNYLPLVIVFEMFFISIVFLFALQFVSSSILQKPLPITPTGAPLGSKFGALVNETIRHYRVPGLSIAAVDGDDVFAEVGRC
jgi:hypothetical protein